MKAVCYYGKEDVRVDTVPDPTILNPRDAIVQITSTAICGSDLHIYGGYIPTMQKGDVDAIHVTEPFTTDVQRKLGARMVVDGGAAPVTDLPMDGYFALESWAKQNPGTAAAFQRAMQKAQAIAADRARVEEVLPTYIRGVDPATSKAMTMPGFPTSNDPARVQRLIDLMKEQGRLTNRLDATTIVFKPA